MRHAKKRSGGIWASIAVAGAYLIACHSRREAMERYCLGGFWSFRPHSCHIVRVSSACPSARGRCQTPVYSCFKVPLPAHHLSSVAKLLPGQTPSEQATPAPRERAEACSHKLLSRYLSTPYISGWGVIWSFQCLFDFGWFRAGKTSVCCTCGFQGYWRPVVVSIVPAAAGLDYDATNSPYSLDAMYIVSTGSRKLQSCNTQARRGDSTLL